jgi:hypothetical protein
MRKWMLGAMGFILLNGAILLAQLPSTAPTGIPAPNGGCCPAACCAKTKTVCVPEHYVKEKQIVRHTFGCEKKCMPYFYACGHDCDHGHCGHVITVRYLIKKVQICDHDAVKCNPVCMPVCQQARPCAYGTCGAYGAVLTRPVIQAPVTAMPTSR